MVDSATPCYREAWKKIDTDFTLKMSNSLLKIQKLTQALSDISLKKILFKNWSIPLWKLEISSLKNEDFLLLCRRGRICFQGRIVKHFFILFIHKLNIINDTFYKINGSKNLNKGIVVTCRLV